MVPVDRFVAHANGRGNVMTDYAAPFWSHNKQYEASTIAGRKAVLLEMMERTDGIGVDDGEERCRRRRGSVWLVCVCVAGSGNRIEK